MTQKEGGTEQGRLKTEESLGTKTMAGAPMAGGGVVVEVREKKGTLRAAIPTMPFPVAVICLFLNTFIPGLGTFVSAFTVLCGARSELIAERGVCCVFWLNVAAALIQILTAVIMVGWIMSIFWGMDMVILARVTPELAPAQRKSLYPPSEPRQPLN
ncbi:protein stum homolog isoform X1 [Xiphophorus maculatus]|uniref:Stum, mechanosensory transduction mediator homolog n=1 Tax=Xiphophorus maculatus TaxID=8083 RepID=M3ZY02_XIPMA|nr:protein stum homolog isoform X1 [Xiphophorus maculatus]